MTRAIYRSLLRLHPPSFRREFAAEMLWIFDESLRSEGAAVLLLDVLISVARQWLARSGVWKVALALIGASLQVLAGGLGFVFRPFMTPPRVNQNAAAAQASMNDLILVTLLAVGIVFVMLFALALWVNSLNRKRLNSGKALTQKWRIKA